MSPYTLKQTLQMQLNLESRDGKIFLDSLGGPKIITKILRRKGVRVRAKERFEGAGLLASKMEGDHEPRKAGDLDKLEMARK